MILHERIVTIEEDYEITEVEIDDSDLKNFIDLKYSAEEIIDIAKQLDKSISDSDLDAAYSVILTNFDSTADKDGENDIDSLKRWIEDEIYQNFDLEEGTFVPAIKVIFNLPREVIFNLVNNNKYNNNKYIIYTVKK